MNIIQILITCCCIPAVFACNENIIPVGQRENADCADSLVLYKQLVPPGNAKTDLDGNIIVTSFINYRLYIFSNSPELVIDSVIVAKEKVSDPAITTVKQKPLYGGPDGKQLLVGETSCPVTEVLFAYSGPKILTNAQENDVVIHFHSNGKAYTLTPNKTIELDRMVTQ